MDKRAGYLTLVVLTALACVAIADDGSLSDIKLLCDDQPVKLTSISQVRSLIEQLESKPEVKCNKSVRKAISNVQSVIEEEDACSDNKIGQISKFHARYLSKRAKRRRNLPAALRRFVMAYALRVSTICKDSMADLLFENEAHTNIDRFDDILNSQKGLHDKLDKIAGSSLTHSNPILFGIIGASAQSRGKIRIVSKGAEPLKKMQEICTKELRPHYRKLIFPVSRLAGMGFDYGSESFERVSKNKESELTSWYKATLICESISLVEVVEPSRGVDQEDGVTLISADDETKELNDDDIIKLKKPFSKHEILLVNDKVLDNSDERMESAINQFKSDLNRKELKQKLKSLLNLLKNHIQANKIRFSHHEHERSRKNSLIRIRRSYRKDSLTRRSFNFIFKVIEFGWMAILWPLIKLVDALIWIVIHVCMGIVMSVEFIEEKIARLITTTPAPRPRQTR